MAVSPDRENVSIFENYPQLVHEISDIFMISRDRPRIIEPPHRDGSNEYPQSMFYRKIRKKWYTPAYTSFGYHGVYHTRNEIKLAETGMCS